MPPAPSKVFPQYGCLFCERSYAYPNLLIKHQDKYLQEYCDVYHPSRRTTKFHAASHPVPVLRYARHVANRHPGHRHQDIMWEEVTFRPWSEPVDTMVRLESKKDKRRHKEEYRYLTAEQWIARLGEIVQQDEDGDEQSEEAEESEAEESEEEDEHHEDDDEEADEDDAEQDPADDKDREGNDEESEVDEQPSGSDDDPTDEQNGKQDEHAEAMNLPPSDDTPETPLHTPTRANGRGNFPSAHNVRQSNGHVSGAAGARFSTRPVSAEDLQLNFFGRDANITFSARKQTLYKDSGKSKLVISDADSSVGRAPPCDTPLPVRQPTSVDRAAQFYTPGNTMPVFVRLRILLHPCAPAWVVPVPAPAALDAAVEVVRNGLVVRGVGGDGFPALVGLADEMGLIGEERWAGMMKKGGVADVELVWDI